MSQLYRSRTAHSRRLVQKLSAYAAAATSLAASDLSASVVHVGLDARQPLHGFHVDFNLDGVDEIQFVSEDFTRGCHDTNYGHQCETSWSAGKRVVAKGRQFAQDGDFAGVITRSFNSTSFQSGLARRFNRDEHIELTTQDFNFAIGGTLSYDKTFWEDSGGCNYGCDFRGGEFRNKRGFLGLSFALEQGSFHYGWADVSSSFIYGFAYETESNVPILAGAVPEAPSLALLAAGAAGLAMLRRKRRSLKSESAPSGR